MAFEGLLLSCGSDCSLDRVHGCVGNVYGKEVEGMSTGLYSTGCFGSLIVKLAFTGIRTRGALSTYSRVGVICDSFLEFESCSLKSSISTLISFFKFD